MPTTGHTLTQAAEDTAEGMVWLSASSEQKPNRTGAHGKHREGAQPSPHRQAAQACRARPRRSGLTHRENQRFPFPEQGTQGGDKR